jgi:hypothetical protein
MNKEIRQINLARKAHMKASFGIRGKVVADHGLVKVVFSI